MAIQEREQQIRRFNDYEREAAAQYEQFVREMHEGFEGANN